jgi:outer membrane lipoprotein SlyB
MIEIPRKRRCLVRKLVLRLFVLAFGLALCLPAQAQFGGLMKRGDKDKDKSVQVSDKPPEYSDKDKQTMAEIAQRPAVQDQIQKAWDEQRREDLATVYMINRTESWGMNFNDDPMRASATNMPDHLYSNPMLQRYLNAIGQRLVPKDSPNLYAFRIVADPIPSARSLSTGTVYISTGLISMLDNEAQLSYILAHEIAHVERKHQYNKIRDSILEDKLNEEKQANAEKKRAILGIASAMGGGLIGGMAGGGNGALTGSMLGLGAGSVIGQLAFRAKTQITEWTTVEEDEADQAGLQYMLEQNYDAREIPRLYTRLDRIVGKDSRVGLGFMGNPRRVKERTTHIQELLAGTYKADMDKKLKATGLVGSSPEFPVIMSAVKRDNGILAMKYDLFEEARQNLEDSLAIRSSDPTVYYYLGKVGSLTARTPEDRQQAVTYITNAIRYDAERGALPDPHLEYALNLMSQRNPANNDSIVKELKTYVTLYQRDNGGALPGNMYAINDYFSLVGETSWYLPPGWYPATQMQVVTVNSANPVIAPDPTIKKALAVNAAAESAPAGANPGVKQVSQPHR